MHRSVLGFDLAVALLDNGILLAKAEAFSKALLPAFLSSTLAKLIGPLENMVRRDYVA
jgi:hypothetical protein